MLYLPELRACIIDSNSIGPIEVLSKLPTKQLGWKRIHFSMKATTDPQVLREEYDIYVSMWNDAKVVDGPNSPVARFAKRLVRQALGELAILEAFGSQKVRVSASSR